MTTPAWSFESPVEYYIAKSAASHGTYLRDVPAGALGTLGAQSTTQLPPSNGSSSSGAASLARQPTLGRSPRPSPKPSPITPTAPSFVSERRKSASECFSARGAGRPTARGLAYQAPSAHRVRSVPSVQVSAQTPGQDLGGPGAGPGIRRVRGVRDPGRFAFRNFRRGSC